MFCLIPPVIRSKVIRLDHTWRVLRRNWEYNEDLQSPALLKEEEDFCDLVENGSNQMLVMGVQKLDIRSVYQAEGFRVVLPSHAKLLELCSISSCQFDKAWASQPGCLVDAFVTWRQLTSKTNKPCGRKKIAWVSSLARNSLPKKENSVIIFSPSYSHKPIRTIRIKTFFF